VRAIAIAIALGVLLPGCRKETATGTAEASSSSTSSATGTATPRAGPGASAASSAFPQAHALRALVLSWNAAINAHDAERVGALYADDVELYGTKMSRDRAIAAKKGAFVRHARDEIADLAVDEGGRATFTKKTTSKDGKTIEVLGYLEARQVQGAWKIVVEGDTTTDRNLERARERRCTSAVLAIVHATDEAKRAMASIEQGAKKQPASDPVNVAGRVMPPQAGSSEWYVGICEDHADRMLCLNHFEVSKDTGVVRYMGIEGSDPDWHAIKTDPRLMADVVSSCK
jgi:ketosteroid isomerase-like protein